MKYLSLFLSLLLCSCLSNSTPSGNELDDYQLIDLTNASMMSASVDRASRFAILLKNYPGHVWLLPKFANVMVEFDYRKTCCLVDNASVAPDGTKELFYFSAVGLGETRIQFRAHKSTANENVSEDIVVTLNLLVK